MSWIEIGILVFIFIICFIVAILFFLSLNNLGKSRAGIVDDEPTDTAYSWGTWATLAIVISIALIISNIILYYYELSGMTMIKVLLFITFILLLFTGYFALRSNNFMNSIQNPDPEIDIAKSYMYYGAILSFVAAFFVVILFAMSIFADAGETDVEVESEEEITDECLIEEGINETDFSINVNNDHDIAPSLITPNNNVKSLDKYIQSPNAMLVYE